MSRRRLPRSEPPSSRSLDVVCVGDCGVDRYVSLGENRPGGMTLNVAVHARACLPPADRVTVVTALGRDAEAEMVIGAIERFGLTTCLTRLEGRTPVQYIELEPSGEKRFVRYDEGVLATFRLGDRERACIAASDLVVMNVYRQVVPFFDDLVTVPSRGARFVDFLDLADFDEPVSAVTRYVPHFDIGQFGLSWREPSLIDALELLARTHDRLFLVTLGSDGSLALGGPDRIHCQAEPVPQIVDTTGAGDAFAAGFLASHCHGADVATAMRAGSALAAWAVQRLGAF